MKGRRTALVVLLLAASSVALLGVAGCSSAQAPTQTGSAPAKSPMATQVGSSSTGSVGMAQMDCGPCKGKGKVSTVGTVKVVDGVQVVEIGIVGGTYAPNTFTAKAGMPIKVTVSGKATKCMAKPTFPALKKSVNIADTGTGTIDLGTLSAGTYELTCGMGSHGGNLIVQ